MSISKYIYTFFVTFIFINSSFAQDTLYLKNNIIKTVKLIEVNTSYVVYKNLNQSTSNGDTLFKNEIVKIKYQNGIVEIIPRVSTTQQLENLGTYEPQNIDSTTTFGDYIKFSVNVGVIISNSFSNVPRHLDVGVSHSETYKKNSDKQYVTPNIGFTFLFGKSKYVKHVVAANYIHSKGDYYYTTHGPYYKVEGVYKSEIDFINLVSGLRITFFKKLHFEPLIALNINIINKTTFTGYESITESSYPYQTTTITQTNATSRERVGNTFSLCPKLSYEFSNRFLKSEIYVSYNYGVEYKLPWYQFGVNVYPIKKMR
jgi:hypothetical protein